MSDERDRILAEYHDGDNESVLEKLGFTKEEIQRLLSKYPDVTIKSIIWKIAQAQATTELNSDKEVEPPKPQSLTEAIKDTAQEIEWRINGWISTNSRVILGAQAKTGKTTAAYNLTKSLVDGTLWLGKFKVNSVASVAYLDFEMSEDMGTAWLRDLNIENTDNVFRYPLRGQASSFDILNEDKRAKWAERLKGTKFLITDCLDPVFAALSLDVNNNNDAGRFLSAYDRLLIEADITESVLIHHAGHTQDRLRGASRLLGWPDALWMMGNHNSHKQIWAEGRDVNQPKSTLIYDPESRNLSIESRPGEAALIDLDDTAKLVGRALYEHFNEAGTTNAQVRDYTGLSDKTVSAAFARLYSLGIIEWLNNSTGKGKTQKVRLTSAHRPGIGVPAPADWIFG